MLFKNIEGPLPVLYRSWHWKHNWPYYEKSNSLSSTWTNANTFSKRPERGQRRKWWDKEQWSLSPSCSIRWGNSRRQGHKDMSAQLRNGGCLTLFPAFPSPSPFPSDTLPNTDWAVCVASCYCRRSSERCAPCCFPGNTLRAFPPPIWAPICSKVQLKSCRKTKKRRKGRLREV